MTREEIDNRTIDAAAAIDKGDSAVTVIKLRPHFESLVRATLEKAARAVCPGCSGTGRIADHSPPCYAIKIHDLIAALDGGVE